MADISTMRVAETGSAEFTALLLTETKEAVIAATLNLEQQAGKIMALKEQPSIAELQHNLATRRGFVVDRGTPGKMGLYSKISVTLAKTAAGDSGESCGQAAASGEIEISFAPLKREYSG